MENRTRAEREARATNEQHQKYVHATRWKNITDNFTHVSKPNPPVPEHVAQLQVCLLRNLCSHTDIAKEATTIITKTLKNCAQKFCQQSVKKHLGMWSKKRSSSRSQTGLTRPTQTCSQRLKNKTKILAVQKKWEPKRFQILEPKTLDITQNAFWARFRV